MLVKNWMSRDVVTIDRDDSMTHVMKLLKDHNIRMIPVMNKGRLTGVVTDRDIRSASASKAISLEIHELAFLISRIKVRQIMTPDPITVESDYTVEETAEILLRNKINGVPVVDQPGGVVGVITQSDIFRVFISLTGLSKKGIHFDFELEDRPGSIKEVTDVIRRYGGRISSILSSYENAREGYRKVYIRTYDIGEPLVVALKEEVGKIAKILYVVAHQGDKREVYEAE
jgi:acetoin utilization protein AcuB